MMEKIFYINNFRINESKIQNPKYFPGNEQHLCNEEVLKSTFQYLRIFLIGVCNFAFTIANN